MTTDRGLDPDGPATGQGIFGLDDALATAGVVLLAVPWEATTSYRRGTAQGPEAIRRASAQIDLFDLDTGRPYEAGIALVDADAELIAKARDADGPAQRVIAAHEQGNDPAADDLAEVNALSAWLNDHVGAATRRWLDQGKLVGIVGGDHAVAYGSIAEHARRYPTLGVLQFDAHADLRVAYEGFVDSHASVMHRVRSTLPSVHKIVSVGVRDLGAAEHAAIVADDGIEAFFDRDLRRRVFDGEAFRRIAESIADALPNDVYVSFDIDGLDPSLCPNTGTPVPGGLSFAEACAVLAAVVDSGRRIVGFDLCEVAPGPGGDEWDANVGARVLYKLIGYALKSRAAAPAT